MVLLTSCSKGNQDMTIEDGEVVEVDTRVDENKPLRVPYFSELYFDDVNINRTAERDSYYRNVHEGIYTYSETGELIEGVGENIRTEFQDGYLVFTIDIRDDAYFHNGKKLQASDIQYSIFKIAGLAQYSTDNLYLAGQWKNLLNGDETNGYKKGKTEIINEKEIKLYLDPSYGIEPTKYILADTYILDRNSKDTSIGLGPYKVVESAGSLGSYKLSRFEEYYGDKPEIKNIELIKYGDFTLAEQGYRAGEIDLLKSLDNNNKALSSRTTALFFNLDDKTMSSLNLRKAISLGIDKEAILDRVGSGGEILYSHLNSENKYFDSGVKEENEYDLEKAKEYLSRAGYSNGLELTISLSDGEIFNGAIIAEISKSLEELGINIVTEILHTNDFNRKVYSDRDFQIALTTVNSHVEPFRALSMYNSGTKENIPGIKSGEIDKLLSDITTTAKSWPEEQIQMILKDEVVASYLLDMGQDLKLTDDYVIDSYKPIPFLDFSSIRYK